MRRRIKELAVLAVNAPVTFETFVPILRTCTTWEHSWYIAKIDGRPFHFRVINFCTLYSNTVQQPDFPKSVKNIESMPKMFLKHTIFRINTYVVRHRWYFCMKLTCTMFRCTSYVSRTHEKRPYFLYRRPNSLMKFEIFKSNFRKNWEVGKPAGQC